ncbi:unnamed protein product [Coccothraustes coccothraustes]
MPAAGAAGNNSNVTMDPLLRVSVARTDRIHISRDDILASGGVRGRPLLRFSPLPPCAAAPPKTGDRALSKPAGRRRPRRTFVPVPDRAAMPRTPPGARARAELPGRLGSPRRAGSPHRSACSPPPLPRHHPKIVHRLGEQRERLGRAGRRGSRHPSAFTAPLVLSFALTWPGFCPAGTARRGTAMR